MKIIQNIRYLFQLLWNHNKKYFWVTALAFLLPAVTNLIQVVFPREILESLEEAAGFTGTVILAVAMCMLLFVMEMLSSYVEYKKHGYVGDFEIMLNRKLAEAAAEWPYERFEDFASREQYHFAVMCMKEGTADAVAGCVASVAGSILSLLSLLYVSRMVVWWLWMVIALSVLINIGCEICRANYDYRSYEEYSAIDMRMVYSRDVLTWKDFAKETRLFSMYDYVSGTANHYINLLSKLQSRRGIKTFRAYFLSCVFDFLQRVAIFGYISYQAYRGEISIADFSMLTLALITVSALCIGIAKDIVRIGETAKYINAYVDVMKGRETAGHREKAVLDTDGKLRLAFDHVDFSYPGADSMALEDVSFVFESDKKYGLVGANGSGKSTFIHLLMGLYSPVSGSISCNGQDQRDVEGESWKNLFSSVSQDFNTYAYTVRENVTMFREEEGTDPGEALERAGVGWMKGDEYLTSEYAQGRELSGGEAQKLAIARAIYRDARVFVFDEPTAALSPVSEKELYESVFREMKDKMLFLISHRLASCRMCDEILVFEKGKIAEHGSHEELMAKGGLYAEMFRAQADLYGR